MKNLLNNRHEKVRRYERKPFSQTIDYAISALDKKERKWLNLSGNTVDISEGGLGIQTDYPLEPGHMLWFNGGMEQKAGFVRWCAKFDNGYRVGVELDGKQVKHLDEATELFNKRLEEIEQKCINNEEEPAKIMDFLHKAISDVLSVCTGFEREVRDNNIIHDARFRFMEKTNPILSKSYCINRARTWPQGQQGDYKTLEIAYKNTPLSEGIGYYLDLYLLNSDLGNAVRNRIKKLEDILRTELKTRQKPSVLNIACGSCREVFALASDIENSGAKFTCIDLDNDALAFAANRLSYTNISPLSSNQVVLRKYNALRMFDHDLNVSEFGMQDIIYSVGFFDYIQSDFLATLFNSLYKLLKPGGILITSFKDANRYRYHDFHWIVDWDGFLQRKEEDFWKIFSDAKIPYSAVSETREESGVIVFYIVTKKD